jgi:hypothetical protein
MSVQVNNSLNPLTHGGLMGPPLFERPIAKQVMKLQKLGKIIYPVKISPAV